MKKILKWITVLSLTGLTAWGYAEEEAVEEAGTELNPRPIKTFPQTTNNLLDLLLWKDRKFPYQVNGVSIMLDVPASILDITKPHSGARDEAYNPKIDEEDKRGNGHIIAYDTTHFSTARMDKGGFGKLLTEDGYVIQTFDTPFPGVGFQKDDAGKLKLDDNGNPIQRIDDGSCNDLSNLWGCDYYQSLLEINTLVMAHIGGEVDDDKSYLNYHLSDSEAAVLKHWMSQGGNLFFIADHTPFPKRSAAIAKAFDLDWPEQNQVWADGANGEKELDEDTSSDNYFPGTAFSVSGTPEAPNTDSNNKPILDYMISADNPYRIDESIQFSFLHTPVQQGTIFDTAISDTDHKMPLLDLQNASVAKYKELWGLRSPLPTARIESFAGSVLKPKRHSGSVSQDAIQILVAHEGYDPNKQDEIAPFPVAENYSTGVLLDFNVCSNDGKRGRAFFGGELSMWLAGTERFHYRNGQFTDAGKSGMHVPTNDNENLLRNIMMWLHQPC